MAVLNLTSVDERYGSEYKWAAEMYFLTDGGLSYTGVWSSNERDRLIMSIVVKSRIDLTLHTPIFIMTVKVI